MRTGPHPALQRLQPLIGVWTLTGRTLGSKEDDVRGTVTIEWLAGGHFQEQRGVIEIVSTGMKVEALEIVGYDPDSDTFPSTVYDNLGDKPVSYGWDVRGSAVTHWTRGSRYSGRLSADGRTISGGWRADDGSADPENSFDAIMTRIK